MGATTTTTTEAGLRATLRGLQGLWVELEAAKYPTPTRITNPQGGRKPGAHPTTPGGAATALDIDLTLRLFEVARDVADYIQPERILTCDAHQLLRFMDFNAGLIAGLDFAPDIHAELRHQESRILEFLRAGHPMVCDVGEPWLTWRTIIHAAHAEGYTVSRALLRKWAERGHIDTRLSADRIACYRLGEVLGRLKNMPLPAVTAGDIIDATTQAAEKPVEGLAPAIRHQGCFDGSSPRIARGAGDCRSTPPTF